MDLGAKQSTEQLQGILRTGYHIQYTPRYAPDSDVIEKLSRIKILVTIVYYTEYDVIDTQMSGSKPPTNSTTSHPRPVETVIPLGDVCIPPPSSQEWFE